MQLHIWVIRFINQNTF